MKFIVEGCTLRRQFAWRAELRELDAQIESEPLPTLASPRIIRSHWTTEGYLVWRLPVPGKADVFMSIQPWEIDSDVFVVPVHAAAFHRLWLSQDLRRPDSCRLRSELTTDYKYHWAVKGFAAGEENSVPLADVSFYRGSLRFTDGVTRTFWLLANNVAAFPVKIYRQDEAAALAKHAGLQPEPMQVPDLFKNAEPKHG